MRSKRKLSMARGDSFNVNNIYQLQKQSFFSPLVTALFYAILDPKISLKVTGCPFILLLFKFLYEKSLSSYA